MRTATNGPKAAEAWRGRAGGLGTWGEEAVVGWVGVSRGGSLGFAVSPVETAHQGGLGGVRASPDCGPRAHPAQGVPTGSEKAGGFWESQALTCPETGWRPQPQPTSQGGELTMSGS